MKCLPWDNAVIILITGMTFVMKYETLNPTLPRKFVMLRISGSQRRSLQKLTILSKNFFDNKCDNDESVLIKSDDVLCGLDCSEDFDCKLFLNSIKLPPNEKKPLVMDIKNVIDSINSPETFLEFKKFFRIQWNRKYRKIRECVLANKERKVRRKHFTAHFGELHQMVVSENCLQEFATLRFRAP